MKVLIYRDGLSLALRKIVIEISDDKGVVIERRRCFGSICHKLLKLKLERIVERMLDRIEVYHKVIVGE